MNMFFKLFFLIFLLLANASCTTTVVDSSVSNWSSYESTLRAEGHVTNDNKEMLKTLLKNYGNYVFQAQPSSANAKDCLSCVGIVEHKAILDYFNDIVKRLDPTRFFVVIPVDTNDIFATALPGGYIIVSTGALRIAQSDSEAAGIIAIEMSHFALGHYKEKMNRTGGPDSRVLEKDHRLELMVRGLFQARNTKSQTFSAALDAVNTVKKAGYDPKQYYSYLTATKNIGTDQLNASHKTHSPLEEQKNSYKRALRQHHLSPAYSQKPINNYLRLWENLRN
jgi:hypothetical protein